MHQWIVLGAFQHLLWLTIMVDSLLAATRINTVFPSFMLPER